MIDFSNLDILFQQTNLAKGMDEKELTAISSKVVNDFENDMTSRKEWEEMYNEWIKLATQVMEVKSFPWDNASNVKFPLLATAAMQFHARSYPTLISGPKIVKTNIYGDDPDNQKAKRAERISKHMSYQLMEEMPDWDEEMDKGLYALPIIGCIFKKVYFDPTLDTNVSELVYPKDLVVNYWAKSLETAITKTHIIHMTRNKVKEKQLNDIFLEFDLAKAAPKDFEYMAKTKENENLSKPGNEHEVAPLTILEQHRWYDLDKDGYEEPYIITIEYSTGKVLRIIPRFQKDGVKTAEGKVLSIKPEEYFVKFSFIPNPDGGFYDLGFGALLGPLNLTVNTLINLLVDSGTVNNLQSGFISKGIRMKMGESPLIPGEWRQVQTTGDDLRKGIFPLPTKEPSSTLFQLLGTMVESGNKLASVAEIFVGKMPGQNTPATTTMATIEQGMKVFTAIYKRIYRSLTKEFKRLYELNKLYLDAEKEFRVLDSQELMQTGVSDYQADDTDVYPAADPSAVSEMLRMHKAQALLELMALGTLNPMEVTKRILEAQEQTDIEKLINQGPPPPDPKMQEAQMKMQSEQAKSQLKQQELQMKMQMEQEMGKMDMQMKQMDLQLKAVSAQLDMEINRNKAIADSQKIGQDMQVKQMQGVQKLQFGEVTHQQKMRQAREKPVKKEK